MSDMMIVNNPFRVNAIDSDLSPDHDSRYANVRRPLLHKMIYGRGGEYSTIPSSVPSSLPYDDDDVGEQRSVKVTMVRLLKPKRGNKFFTIVSCASLLMFMACSALMIVLITLFIVGGVLVNRGKIGNECNMVYRVNMSLFPDDQSTIVVQNEISHVKELFDSICHACETRHNYQLIARDEKTRTVQCMNRSKFGMMANMTLSIQYTKESDVFLVEASSVTPFQLYVCTVL